MVNELKALHPNERDGSILVSFSTRWDSVVRRKNINIVFRKRIPTSFNPTVLYFYIASPISAIIGMADIDSVQVLSKKHALTLADAGKINSQELLKYIGDSDDIGAFFIRNIRIFNRSLELNVLSDKYGFIPPQSFFAFSKDGVCILENELILDNNFFKSCSQ